MESVNGSNGLGHRPASGASSINNGLNSPATGTPVGEIIDTSVSDFMAQACELNVAPPFGGFVKVTVSETATVPGNVPVSEKATGAGNGTVPERIVYAVVYAIHTGSLEPGGRPVLRGRDGMRDRAIFDENPDLEQLLRTEFSALIIGFTEDGVLRSYLPPSPPPLHWSVVQCDPTEIAGITQRLDYFRTILSASNAPVDALIAANVRLAGAANSDPAAFRLRAGRELATLLKYDYPRLTAILHALVD